jgi:uncharacterized secreted protein with C-terminal beta-propeller domain
MIVGLALIALSAAGCASTASAETEVQGPAELVPVDGSDIQKVRLTERAIERIDLQTSPVAEREGTKVVPYEAIVYDASGETYVYTTTAARTYMRSPVTVFVIDGEDAVLTDGPDVGTEVVTIGTAELFGVEKEIGY